MSFNLRKCLSVVILAMGIAFFSTSLASADAPLTKCNIRIDDPHLSTYLRKSEGIIAVKVNARSKCDKPMWDLVLRVEIFKVGLFRDYLVGQYDLKIKGYIAKNKEVKNQETFAECESRKLSRFYGKAIATATVDGKAMRTWPLLTEKTVTLPCGT